MTTGAERSSAESADGAPSGPERQRPLSAAARRALDEAAARRSAPMPKDTTSEKGGRGGLEPVRYGDWEVKGLASDF
ncbi:DUF1674 domain-containing protein [Lichenihabitans sp. Uapishka_5]|uniref:DUF1674 domain-containing protein n=1 Tax=Lichenihabitans sp. Uapishka_5 TaxID=3037302 RepID=UPI0029E7EC37|nr:DUF1674 domain-containing protein [Lichenihabitans sp. Uapishka_5]MDX7953349.1 DUF1674 domain-containing protein [Lichenihabitans sp. Uapishka_5]